MNKVSMFYAALLFACLLTVTTRGANHSRDASHATRSADVRAVDARTGHHSPQP